MKKNELLLDLSADRSVLLFTAAIALLTVLLIGLPAGWRAVRCEVAIDLTSTTRTGDRHGRLESWLVGGQVAFATMLLITAGLFVTSLERLLTADVGFRTDS